MSDPPGGPRSLSAFPQCLPAKSEYLMKTQVIRAGCWFWLRTPALPSKLPVKQLQWLSATRWHRAPHRTDRGLGRSRVLYHVTFNTQMTPESRRVLGESSHRCPRADVTSAGALWRLNGELSNGQDGVSSREPGSAGEGPSERGQASKFRPHQPQR